VHRFYIAPAQWNPEALTLNNAQAHHARDVLRLKTGDRVALFNGRGHEITAEISEIDRDGLSLRKLHEARTPPMRCRITLAQAIPKGKNMELIVQKAVEIGAAEIVPLISERTVVHLESRNAAAKQAKWQSVAIEAAKQCGQNWLPDVRLPETPRDFFRGSAATADLKLIGSLQSDARHLKMILADYEHEHLGRPRSILICVGPEGDFTPAELNLARTHGCQPITLGPIILRVETAAIYCMSVLSYELFQ
jgi:16S rRNA (uracil1498-N3)-methyltransferase